MRYETRSALDPRSVVIAVVVLLLGVGLGFGVGYKYEQHSAASKSSSHSTASSGTPTTSANNAGSSAVAKLNAGLIACMAKQGVKYPSSSSNILKPPAGVTQAKYDAARAVCVGGFLKH